MLFPEMKNENPIYIWDLSFKSTDIKNMEKVKKDIQDLMKKYKQRDKERQEDQQLVKIEPLIALKERKVAMDNYFIRPPISNKKSVG